MEAQRHRRRSSSSSRSSQRKARLKKALRFERILGIGCLLVFIWAIWQWQATNKTSGDHAVWQAVEDGPIAQPILADGALLPAVLINITPPFDGKILKKFVQAGDKVSAGAPLVELDSSDAQAERRDAEVAQTRAEETLRDLKNWSANPEVSTAQRQLARTKSSFEQAEKKYQETDTLFKKGIVARTELDSAQNERSNARSELLAAQEGLSATLKKGSASQIRIAELEHQNRRDKLQQIQRRLDQTLIRSPQAGIVLFPISDPNTSSGNAKEIEVGSFVSSKDVMMSIGNTNQLMIRSQLDEFDIARVKPGLPVEITLGSDKSLTLEGELQRISAQAKKGDNAMASAPTFEIQVLIRKIPETLRPHIRLGMTAHLSIYPERGKTALSIPLNAVSTDENGRASVTRRNSQHPQGEQVFIQTGSTQAERIVVLKGLQPGDEILVPSTSESNSETNSEMAPGNERPGGFFPGLNHEG